MRKHTRESNAGLRQPKGLNPARWQLLLGKMKKCGGEGPSNVAGASPVPPWASVSSPVK